ncbi:conjugal transfer protein TrbI [Robbsia sp. Bb-Pol-6]|uniref:Conjugal transfer protein TrbI n=1 Tax=Robbsia betulipollinis TaxID=2981849 RepID=A0ABT3ZJM7_9BURK|nr:TrbI/VirB10 family protein [Robbsia betulipollinis]MCY0386741.1 conjugal transfer protein TrbI [Robbsia betulipollinis]
MNDNGQMSGATSPGSTPGGGVRRVNSVPLILAVCALGVFAALIAMVAVKRSNDAIASPQDVAQTAGQYTDTSAMALQIMGEHRVGLIPADVPAPAAAPEASVDNADTPPALLQRSDTGAPTVTEDPHLQQIRAAKMQMFERAVKARTSVALSGAAATHDPATPTRDGLLARIASVGRQIDAADAADPALDYKAQLTKANAILGIADDAHDGDLPGAPHDGPERRRTPDHLRNDVRQFDGSGKSDRWMLDQAVQPPRSRFEIRAGSVLPGVMISGVDSDLPGQIFAQISQNVFDTATGRHLLIPQGTRLIGAYNSNVAYGQNAVLIAWQRLVFPDGKALDIGAMPGADSAGYAGFRDQVNNHYLRIFASAILMSGVTAAASYATARRDGNGGVNQQPTVNGELSQALGQQLGNVTAQMIAKNLNIAPTIEIRPGYRFNIVVTKDLDFTQPYMSFDYRREGGRP